MSFVPGFRFDLFVSYAHTNNLPLKPGLSGWVSEFIAALEGLLRQNSREFKLWFDPQLRSGEDFNDAIAQGISESALFLSILSPAYDDSSYCKKEVTEFRRQRHPSFGMKVGTMSRMQAIVLEALGEERWPPELRSTSPPRFFNDEVDRFFQPAAPDEKHPYIKALFKVRKSIWDVLNEMKERKDRGTVIERSYDVPASQSEGKPVLYVGDVPDSLYYKREELLSALRQLNEFSVEPREDVNFSSGPAILSVHMFDKVPGRPFRGQNVPLSRLQLEAAIAANPARRPLVWLARDLDPKDAETKPHEEFLSSLFNHKGIELLRTGFEDLKDEIQKRMRPRSSPAVKTVRRTQKDLIVHIWHEIDNPQPLAPLKQYLIGRNCGISVFPYSGIPKQQLQSKLSSCDGLIIPYTSTTRAWAEDVMTEAFRLRRRQELPIAFAAVELPPPSGEDFNFEHPRVVPIHSGENGNFRGIDEFLRKLEAEDE